MREMRDTKGITLIALVITIIVLLILAGVTISLVLNQGGIFEKANQAKEATSLAEEKEQLLLAIIEARSNQIIEDKVLSDELDFCVGKVFPGAVVEEKQTNDGYYVTLVNGHQYELDSNGDIIGYKEGQVVVTGKANAPKIAETGLTGVYWDESGNEVEPQSMQLDKT